MTNEIVFLGLTEYEKRELCPVPPPKPPGKDWRWWSLWIPAVVGAFGLFLFNTPGIAFIQLHDQPQEFLRFFVIAGSLLMMFGSDVGSVFAVFEIFRKHSLGGAGRWDWIGLAVSCSAAISSMLLSWSWQLHNVGVEASWIGLIKVYGPAFATISIILDLVVSSAEAGMFLGTFDKRLREWEKKEFRPWVKEKEAQASQEHIYEIPTGADAYTPKMPEPTPSTSEPPNSKILRCWCGAPVTSEEEYHAHCRAVHYGEVWWSGGSVIRDAYTARETLAARYAATAASSDWAIPTVETIAQWRREQG